MLSSKGILVTFINTESNHSKMMKARSYHDGTTLGPNSNIRFAQVSDGLPLEFNRTANRTAVCECVYHLQTSLNDYFQLSLSA
jgi:hypothetical protein